MADPLDLIPEDLVDLAEVAKRLGRRTDSLWKDSQKGKFPECFQTSDRTWRVSADAVRRWFASRSTHALDRSGSERRARVVKLAGLDLRTPMDA